MSRRMLPLLLFFLMVPAARLPAQAPGLPPQAAGQEFQGQPGAQQYAPPPNFGQGGAQPFSGPTQPVVPNTPAAQRVIRPPVMRNAPFELTKEQFQDLMAVLSAWEQQSSKVDLLRCNMEILEYDLTFPITVPPAAAGQPQQVKPNHVWQGELKYQAPDKGWFEAKSENTM